MGLKDYYKILELPPNAGDALVKKHFRRLAQRYHPDKHDGNSNDAAWYREIQEAYEILSDPRKKAKYLQERWLLKSKGIPFEVTQPLTPEFIEKRFSAFRQTVASMDHFRMDHFGLQKQLLQLTSDEIINALQEHQDQKANQKIVDHLLTSMEPLAYPYLEALKPALLKIALHHPFLNFQIEKWYGKRKKQLWWDRNQGWVIAAITFLLCVLIGMIAGK